MSSRGHAIYLGPSLGLAPHSTSIDCLIVGVDGPFTVRRAGAPDIAVRSAYIRARSLHQIVSEDGLMLFAYFDPRSARAAECLGRMTRSVQRFGFDHNAEAELIALCRDPIPDPDRILSCAADTGIRRVDARIVEAIEIVRTQPGRSDSAVELARRAGLSTAYFLRLFAAQTGTSLRRYRLWARMLHVAQGVSSGNDFTTAATDAGFASPTSAIPSTARSA